MELIMPTILINNFSIRCDWIGLEFDRVVIFN